MAPLISGFKLPLHLKQMGDREFCGHRSGWRFVMDHLRRFHDSNGPLLDDFVERSFQNPRYRQQWREPWVGIFHHAPNLPSWLDPTAPIQAIIATPEFQASLPHLKGAIALSQHLAGWLQEALQCPVLVLKHPTELPAVRFSMKLWEAQPERQLVQVGWYGRNLRGIYQVDVPESFRKIHLLQDRTWIARAIERTDTSSPHRDRPWRDHVEIVHELDDFQFDQLLASSLIFNEYWDVSASNTVIEAIARCTPMVVNRHPALVEYLGSDYPLFFDDIENVKEMLTDRDCIRLTSEHLLAIDKSWISAERFAEDILRFVHSVAA